MQCPGNPGHTINPSTECPSVFDSWVSQLESKLWLKEHNKHPLCLMNIGAIVDLQFALSSTFPFTKRPHLKVRHPHIQHSRSYINRCPSIGCGLYMECWIEGPQWNVRRVVKSESSGLVIHVFNTGS